MYLQNVTDSGSSTVIKEFSTERSLSNLIKRKYGIILQSFIKYLVENNKIQFNYMNGSFGISMSFIDFNVFISNEFIEWWNYYYPQSLPTRENLDRLLRDSLLVKSVITGNTITVKSARNSSIMEKIRIAEQQFACTFKGERIPIKITKNPGFEHDVLLLNIAVVQSIYSKILAIININYGTRTITSDPNTNTQRISYRVQGNSKTILTNY